MAEAALRDLSSLPMMRIRDVRHRPKEALTALRHDRHALVRIHGWRGTAVIILRPALVHQVLAHGHRYFDKGAETTRFRFLAGDGNATSRRLPLAPADQTQADRIADWRRRRRHAFAATFGSDHQDDNVDRIRMETAQVTNRWRSGEVRDVAADMYGLALRNFATCFADPPAHHLLAEAARVAARSRRALLASARSDPLRCPHDRDFDLMTRLRQLSPDPVTWRVRWRRRAFQRLFTEALAIATQEGSPRSIFGLLASAAADFTGTTPARSLVSGAISIFLAGYENVSATLAWTLWCLSGAPELQDRIATETKPEDSPLVGAVVAETLRLHPPVWSIPREALTDVRVGGYRVPRGTVLFLSPWIQHFQPWVWDQPDEFLPERFLGSSVPSGSYYPFGAGPRKCQGMNFANRQLGTVIAAIAREWRVHRVHDVAEPTDWFGVVQRPDGPVRLRIERRI